MQNILHLKTWKSFATLALSCFLSVNTSNGALTVTINLHNQGSCAMNTCGNVIGMTDNFGIPLESGQTEPIPAGATYVYQATHLPPPDSWNYTLTPDFTCYSWASGGTNPTNVIFSGGAKTVTLPTTDGSVTYDIYVYGGTCGGAPPASSTTNATRVTLCNNTGTVQYYNFTSQLSTGASSTVSGCSKDISVNGVGGPDGNTPNNYMAVYPGECINVDYAGVLPTGVTGLLTANMAPVGYAFPCGMLVGEPRCVNLCYGDNIPYVGGFDLPVADVGFGQSNTFTTNNSAFGSQTNFNGTNINFAGIAQTNIGAIEELGFGSVVKAVNQASTIAGINNEALQGTVYTNAHYVGNIDSNGFASVSNALTNLSIPTNFSGLSNLAYLTNLGSNIFTNFPTNYPNSQMGGFLSNQASLSNLAVVRTQGSNEFGTNSSQYATSGTNLANTLSNGFKGLVGDDISESGTATGEDGYSITLPPNPFVQTNITIKWANIPVLGQSSFALLRLVIVWVILVSQFVMMLDATNTAIGTTMQQRQIMGNRAELEVLGTGSNAVVPSLALYIPIFISVIGTIPTVLVSFMSTQHTNILASSGVVGMLAAHPAYVMATAAFPLDTFLTAFFGYFTFKYLLVYPLTYATRAIIMFLAT